MAKPNISPLVKGRVRLRLLAELDLATTLAWRNQDAIRRWLLTSDILTPEQHRGWWERYKERDDDLVFVIEETSTLKRPVGQVALYNIDRGRARAEFGRLMIGDLEGRHLGLARLATTRLIEEAFGAWGLRQIYLTVMAENVAALAVYEACGFARVSGDGPLVEMIRTIA